MSPRLQGRLLLILLSLLFAAPPLLAWAIYREPGLRPAASSARGVPAALPPAAGLPRGKWLLVYVAGAACESRCQQRLEELGRVERAMGTERRRVARLLLGGASLPGRPAQTGLAVDALPALWQGALQPGEAVIVDPLGNGVLRYRPGFPARAVFDDLRRLLRLSRVG